MQSRWLDSLPLHTMTVLHHREGEQLTDNLDCMVMTLRCKRSTPCFRNDEVATGGLEARCAGRAKLAPEDLVQAAVRGLAQARPRVAIGHHLHST